MQEILSPIQLEQKIQRLAHELLENCFEEKEVFIGGIHGNGFLLAERLLDILREATDDVKIHLFEVTVNKDEPWSEPIKLSIPTETMKNGFIVLVDDVLNSGKTMQYALNEILQFPTKAIKTLTLVDRTHRRFPIKADFVGIRLSTTLQERVEVLMDENGIKAYLA
ncbi:MAG: phosphoribosyltransferase [Fluviicola sp. XM-24bin1]|jgi:pyrimidine operon attenuation protein/uracil phosphoribosyltransferase|nr:MAG: phosphoribosyltransferase [Fluviicola sp. XM-24bin1]